MQVLFTLASEEVLQDEQGQGQEGRESTGSYCLSHRLSGDRRMHWKCKSLFRSLWPLLATHTRCWPWLEYRLGGHFSYDTPLPLAAQLYPKMCHNQACQQHSCLLSWDGLCGVQSSHRWEKRLSCWVFKCSACSWAAEQPPCCTLSYLPFLLCCPYQCNTYDLFAQI